MGWLCWLRLITDFHCHGFWMPSWERLIDGVLRWRKVAVCNLVDLADEEIVGEEVGVHTHFDGEHC